MKWLSSLMILLAALTACNSEIILTDSQKLEQSQRDANVSSQANSVAVASIGTMGVLTALGAVDPSHLKATVQSHASAYQLIAKNMAPGTKAQALVPNCSENVLATLSAGTGGTMTVKGSCVQTGIQDCSYDFNGFITFNPLVIEIDRNLEGQINVQMKIHFPECTSDLSLAQIHFKSDGLVTVGNLGIDALEAVLSLQVDPLTKAFIPQVQSLTSLARYLTFSCLPTHLAGNCFVDADADLVDDTQDNCEAAYNAAQTDTDTDGFGDICDNCPVTANADQLDIDQDGKGDACMQICAPEIVPCETADNCPIEDGCSEFGCCGECPFEFTRLSCRQADQINEMNGIAGGCEAFNHSCDSEGCCQPLEAPNPKIDYCNDPDFPGFCFFDSGYGFPIGECDSGTFWYAELCVITSNVPSPEANCPELLPGNNVWIPCDVGGQLACNALVASNIVASASCEGSCCVGTPFEAPPP